MTSATWKRLGVLGLLAFALVAFGILTSSRTAKASAPTALIDGATVIGSPSQEELAAIAQGYVVTVVPGATWATMTQAQFGAYDLLIIGDPHCSNTSQAAAANAAVWAPVVMGTAGGRTLAGNRVLIGTDPVFHDGGSYLSSRATIIREGIDFAGKQPGRTGLYFDASCSGGGGAILAALTLLKTGSGAWTNNDGPPCGGSVSLIASAPPAFPTLTTASLQGWGCSVHEAWPTFPTDWSALAVATDTPTRPTCGVDPNTGMNACGQAYILIAGSSIVVISGSIAVTPTDATNPVGTNHTVTAHVTSGGAPLSGQLVTFTVTGQNAGAMGTCVPAGCITDSNGDVSFTYHDGNGAGDDTIKASFTDATGSLQSATAQKHWVGPPPPATLALTPATATNIVGSTHCVTATVKDASGNPTPSIIVRFAVTPTTSRTPPSGSATTNASGQAQFCYTSTLPGSDAIHAYADTNSNNMQDSGEPSGDATKIWTPGSPATLTLSPATATNTVDSQHCVTATVTDIFNNPISGVTVRFSVTPSLFRTPASGSATTNAFGQAQFCYTSALPGADAIHAYADTNSSNMQDAGEPFGDATKTWTAPVSTLCEVKITYGGWITAANTDKGTFGGNAKATGPNSPSGEEEYQDHGPAIPSMDVHSIDVLAVTCTTISSRQASTAPQPSTVPARLRTASTCRTTPSLALVKINTRSA